MPLIVYVIDNQFFLYLKGYVTLQAAVSLHRITLILTAILFTVCYLR